MMPLHSAEHLQDHRSYWWDRRFLDLMAERWELARAASLADIGCGLAHWSRMLYRSLAPGATLVGVDREPGWVARAFPAFRQDYPGATARQIRFLVGDACDLPLRSDSFDVVTCQTLLMHLADPRSALAEMVRIARPGGLVLCVEPNNLINALYLNSLTAGQPVEELVRKFELWLRYQRGRIALGRGDNSIGELLPGLFTGLGLTGISVHTSNKALPYIPPYETAEQQMFLRLEQEWRDEGKGPWNEAEIRRFTLAGGASEELFAQGWEELRRAFDEQREAIRQGTFHAAGGKLTYLVSGRKPSV
jgi:SAM-dependent methyltransferase